MTQNDNVVKKRIFTSFKNSEIAVLIMYEVLVFLSIFRAFYYILKTSYSF